MPNFCFEAIASVWLHTKRQIMKEPIEQQIMESQDSLEQTKRNIEIRECELSEAVSRLTKEAVMRKRKGDVSGARVKMMERARSIKDLKKMQAMLNTIETQLDAIKTCELEKEIMKSLKASSSALKKAGIGVNVNEVESVMSELDDHIKEIQDKTTVLSNPINGMYEDDSELDAELNELLQENEDEYDTGAAEKVPLMFNSNFEKQAVPGVITAIPMTSRTAAVRQVVKEDLAAIAE